MSTTSITDPQSPYRDPACQIRTPGHVCRRRDGALLTGSNGDCYEQAHAETYQAEVA